jgi:xanthine dehydrogenase accessory factor
MPASSFFQRVVELASAGEPFVAVTLVDAPGSTPGDAGSKMIVTPHGRDLGTVGGGRIEARAIDEARQLLTGRGSTRFVDWNLKADVGMTCGGRVRLYFETFNVSTWRIAIFGAGHVTQALARLLTTLPCQVTCIDPRQEWLDQLPTEVATVLVEHPAEHVSQLTDDTYVLCMTQGHATDLPVLERILSTGRQFPYLGVIGSRAKAAVLRRDLGLGSEQPFHCPIGLAVGTNHPGEIAVSIAAQLLEVRDKHQAEPQRGAGA